MLNKILYYFCSEEIKLILKRMEDKPSDFTRFNSINHDSSKFTLTAPNQFDLRWRMLIESGVFSRYESYVLRRRLRHLDIEATRQSVYEVLVLK